MTWNNDGNRIRTIGRADGAAGAWAAQFGSDLPVALRGGRFNGSNRPPYSLLEPCAPHRDLDLVKSAKIAVEVRIERLSDCRRSGAVFQYIVAVLLAQEA